MIPGLFTGWGFYKNCVFLPDFAPFRKIPCLLLPCKSVFFSEKRNREFCRGVIEVRMKKLVIVTYVLRGLGFVLVLLSLFGHSLILNLFPGLEGQSINPIFYSGILVYMVGAVIYFFVNKKEKAERRRREIEEAEERAFGPRDGEEKS